MTECVVVYVLLGEPARAVQYGERAVGLSRETGAAWQHSRQLAIQASAPTQCGRSAEAEELCPRAASLPQGEDWLKFLFGDLVYSNSFHMRTKLSLGRPMKASSRRSSTP